LGISFQNYFGIHPGIGSVSIPWRGEGELLLVPVIFIYDPYVLRRDDHVFSTMMITVLSWSKTFETRVSLFATG
jgi:hypothetical protein